MIHHHPRGKYLSLKTASGETRGYIVAPGQEANARTFIWFAMLRGDLTPAEAALLVKGTVAIETPSASAHFTSVGRKRTSALAAVRRLVGRAIDRVGELLGGECEMGGSSK